MIPLRQLGLLLLLFTVTVAIRWPHIGRPMGKHHEFCTATALRVLTVWHQEGIAGKGYNPATNFLGKANKHINNHASGNGQMVDTDSNYYYVSHPPLAYYLPYAVFSTLKIEPDVVPLQVFNLFIGLLCGLGIYQLARELLPSDRWVGVLAAGIYWFVPAVLWFQGNVYMSDMLVQPFFIAALLLALKVSENPRPNTIILLAITCFLATYTTWFGMLVAGSLGLYFLWKSKTIPRGGYIVLALMLSQILALGLMTWQYSQIAGFDAYWAELWHRFGVRGPGGALLQQLYIIIINYGANYGLLLVVAVAVAWVAREPIAPSLKTFLLHTLVPIGLLHALLPDYSGHDFTTLYLAVSLSVWLAVHISLLGKKWMWAMLAVAIASGPVLYIIANPYGQYSLNGDLYSIQYDEGQLLKQEPADAVLFIIGNTPSPEALWYAQRNVKQIPDEATALEFMQAHSHKSGVLFERPRGGIQRVKTLSL